MSEGDNKTPKKDAKEPRYRTGAHTKTSSKHRLRFHLVFVPKYRKRVLRGPWHRAWRSFCARRARSTAGACGSLPCRRNHVHLLMQLDPSESVSDVVKSLKGGTSRVLRSPSRSLNKTK